MDTFGPAHSGNWETTMVALKDRASPRPGTEQPLVSIC